MEDRPVATLISSVSHDAGEALESLHCPNTVGKPGMNLTLRQLILCSALWLTTPHVLGIEALGLNPIFRWIRPDGSESLAVDPDSPTQPGTGLPPAFHAVVQREWPPGLLPLFPVEKLGRFELRRLPPKGRENFTDPLFFVLPRTDETNASRIAGRWSILSTNRENHRHRLAMDLAVDGEQVAGRLDQDTDYRFAYVTEGSLRTNRLTLTIEYISDRYELTADLHDQKLVGTWRRTDGTDQGTWEATRPQSGAPPPTRNALPLHQWRSPDGRTRYLPVDTLEAGGWQRMDPPLGRVWPSK